MDFEKLLTKAFSLLKKFDPSCMDFLIWQNDLEYLFHLLSIKEHEKTFLLLNMIIPSVFQTIKNEIIVDPFDLSYQMIITQLEKMYTPFTKESAAEYRFNFRDQKLGESVDNYFLTLNDLLSRCGFYTKSPLNLLYRFLHGLSDTKARIRLRQIPNLSIIHALSIAKFIEDEKCNFNFNL